MTPLIVAAAMGMLTGIRASASAEITQRLGVELTTATEQVKAMPYLRCGTPKEYQAAHARWTEGHPPRTVANPRLSGPRFVDVTYWDRKAAEYTTKCSGDDGAQRITVEVGVDGRVARADIVSRAPAGPRGLGMEP